MLTLLSQECLPVKHVKRTIAHSEKKIDEMVYGLYGLSKEEIEIVEEGQ